MAPYLEWMVSFLLWAIVVGFAYAGLQRFFRWLTVKIGGEDSF